MYYFLSGFASIYWGQDERFTCDHNKILGSYLMSGFTDLAEVAAEHYRGRLLKSILLAQ